MRLGTYYRLHLFRGFGLHQAEGRVLDVGGFDGLWASQLPAHARYVLDTSPRAETRNVTYVTGDAQRLPFSDGSFDTVFAFDVIEHVPDEVPVIDEAARVLRRGGRLILTTPSEDIRIFPGLLQSWADRRWGHDRVRGFRADYIRKLLERSGFSEARVMEIGITRFRTRYLLLRLLWVLAPKLGRRLARDAASKDSSDPLGPRGSILVLATC